jgi:hypothetical protein
MHTIYVILGVIVNIVFIFSIIAIVAGLIWITSPPKDKHYLGSVEVYVYYYPFGGRLTGLFILFVGIISLILGLLLDKEHSKMMMRFGSRA